MNGSFSWVNIIRSGRHKYPDFQETHEMSGPIKKEVERQPEMIQWAAQIYKRMSDNSYILDRVELENSEMSSASPRVIETERVVGWDDGMGLRLSDDVYDPLNAICGNTNSWHKGTLTWGYICGWHKLINDHRDEIRPAHVLYSLFNGEKGMPRRLLKAAIRMKFMINEDPDDPSLDSESAQWLMDFHGGAKAFAGRNLPSSWGCDQIGASNIQISTTLTRPSVLAGVGLMSGLVPVLVEPFFPFAVGIIDRKSWTPNIVRAHCEFGEETDLKF